MVRGRCIFRSLSDIIQTVKTIEDYTTNHATVFRILEIKSWLSLEVPISDLTLKIAIREETVAELQLVLNTNAAGYHFTHVVSELQRSTIFSKTKMIDNMFRELNQETSQLTKRALKITQQQQP